MTGKKITVKITLISKFKNDPDTVQCNTDDLIRVERKTKGLEIMGLNDMPSYFYPL